MSLKDHLKKHVGKLKPITWKTDPSILLCPNIPKPMHGVAPRVVLGSKWWNAERRAAYKTTAYHCKACGVHKSVAQSRQWMEGHELYDIDYQKGRMVYIKTVPLCHFCHNYIHDGRMIALLRKGELSQAKFAAIIQHGDDVLFRAKLQRPTKHDRETAMIEAILAGEVAAWKDWRLVVNKKEYPPKFKTEAQWRKAMG